MQPTGYDAALSFTWLMIQLTSIKRCNLKITDSLRNGGASIDNHPIVGGEREKTSRKKNLSYVCDHIVWVLSN